MKVFKVNRDIFIRDVMLASLAIYFQKWDIKYIFENTFNTDFPIDGQEYWAISIKDNDMG